MDLEALRSKGEELHFFFFFLSYSVILKHTWWNILHFPLEVQLQGKYFFGDQLYPNTTSCILQHYTPKINTGTSLFTFSSANRL